MIFSSGGAHVDADDDNAEDKLVVAVAVKPAADSFKKLRLVCAFDKGFSWRESRRCEYSA